MAIGAGYYFDEDAAGLACDFVEAFCRHSTGKFAGVRFRLEPWQRDYVSRLMGWKRPDGTRRFRESYLEISKKNGKSTLAAALALFAVLEEPAAEVYVGAISRKQARIVFTEAARMVASSPSLRRHLRVIDSTARIVYAAGNARLEAMSADSEAQDGANATWVFLDEVHRFKNRRLYDVMKYSGAAREQPLLISMTTAGVDKGGLCYSLHLRARAVLDGTAPDLEFLPVVYGAADSDDLDDPEVWRKANPSLGVILSIDDFRAEYEQAKRIPGQFNNFKRLRLGLWVDAASRWLPLDLWDAGLAPHGPGHLDGRPCYAALDLSSVRDLTSLSLVFPEGEDYRVVNHCWMPEDTVRIRSESDRVPYDDWIAAGWMTATPGNATDYGAIRSRLNALKAECNILQVGIDPWNAQSLSNDLMDDEFDVVEIRQGFPSLTGPCKELERLLLAGRLKHDGNPVMRKSIAACAIETDAQGNIKPSKRRSSDRIDPVVSTVMALGLCWAEAPKPRPGITLL